MWKKKQDNAFHTVKELLKSSGVLVHLDERLPYGVRAILPHQMPNGSECPIGSVSRTLSPAEKRYSQLDREVLAVIFGVKRFHQYLYGQEFEWKTDHKPLIYFFSEKGIETLASGRLQRWALALGAYCYSIHYCEGEDNVTTDAMSRLTIETTPLNPHIPSEVIHLMKYLDASPTTSAQIKTWTDHNPVLSKVREWLLSGWPWGG